MVMMGMDAGAGAGSRKKRPWAPPTLDSEIASVQFTPTSRDEIKHCIAAVEITNPITNVVFDLNNSMHDTRMGAFKNVICGTCHKRDKECGGHAGYIALAAPCINSMFVKTTLKEILNSYCFACFARIKVKVKTDGKNNIASKGTCKCKCKDIDSDSDSDSLQTKASQRKGKDTSHSSSPQASAAETSSPTSSSTSSEHVPPTTTTTTTTTPCRPTLIKIIHVNPGQALRRQHGVKIRFEWVDSGEFISIQDLHNLIARIPREEFLPYFPQARTFPDLTDSVFIHNLVVLPTATRPPNFCNGEWRVEHITRMYINVLKKNLQLRMKINANTKPRLLEEYHSELQSAIDVLFDVNNSNSNLRGNVLQNGGIRQRIDGKQGRLRLNLMGKRVEFSARTVLSGDPRLGLNEVGVPRSVATNLTVPVRVTYHNLGEINKFNVRYITKHSSGQRFDASIASALRIEVGDIVERSLIEGDIVAVNRQPTLHRGSILACRVRIFESKTFRMNYSSLITMNGDCDGDEINLHVPQDLESRAELETLMMTSTNIVCSQASQPLIGCTQDSLLGCYLLSRSFIDEVDFMAILYEMGLHATDSDLESPCCFDAKPDCKSDRRRRRRRRLFSGNRVLTKALECIGVHLARYCPNENFLMVNNEVVFGAMDKSIIGTADDSIIHHIFLQKGHALAGKFIHLMQKAATAFLDIRGFSVGISDCIVDSHEPINFDALDDYLWSDLIQRKGKWTERDEAELCDALAELTKLAPPEAAHRQNQHAGVGEEENRLLDMIQSGAKGSISNYNQITRVVGQQIEEAGRVSKRFTHGTRTLPHFSQHDRSAAANGLVKSSFIKGLSPHEMFFHAMGGRIGIIDTACKTSVTGAQYRRLVKSLEPLVVQNMGDGELAVVNSTTRQLVQMQYGEDSFDGTCLKRRKIDRSATADAERHLNGG